LSENIDRLFPFHGGIEAHAIADENHVFGVLGRKGGRDGGREGGKKGGRKGEMLEVEGKHLSVTEERERGGRREGAREQGGEGGRARTGSLLTFMMPKTRLRKTKASTMMLSTTNIHPQISTISSLLVPMAAATSQKVITPTWEGGERDGRRDQGK